MARLALLRSLGFAEAAAIPPTGSGGRAEAQQALLVARQPIGGRSWALVGGDHAIGEALARRLQARGDRVEHLSVEQDTTALRDAAQLVYLGALPLATSDLDSGEAAARAIDLSCEQPLRWLRATAQQQGRAWMVTQGAQAGAGQPLPGAVWQSPLWGLGRGFALEHPGCWGGLIDLPGADAQRCAELLLRSLDGSDGEDQCAWRDDERLALRLQHDAAPPAGRPPLSAEATYLVTGGFGGLGLLVARWLIEHGARHVALLGRHAQPSAEGVQALQHAGAVVITLEGDVADVDFMTRTISALRERAAPLRGVFHAAAALSSAPLAELSPAAVREMLQPKLAGSVLLERLTRDAGVEFLVLFSSSTALLGATGLAHYAAANAALDALAWAADRPQRRVLSIDWGTWEAMRLTSEESRRGYREAGLLPMPAQDALDALGRLLAAPRVQTMVARIDWAVLKPLHEARRRRPLLAELGLAPAPSRAAARTEQGPGLAERPAALPASMRHDTLVDFVRREASQVLGLAREADVPVGTGLFDLGMDSLMSVELKRRLERGAGCPLPSTLTFNYPNVDALARFLATVLQPRSAPAAPLEASPVPASADFDADLDALTDEELEAG
ncbi:SDR family NAD(P)-dependent oxidoreductase [Piscinibacter aquaticus]|uniref:SDR family NAD(P)-dependent oxidoreductase n=1 Tax=Piscinibacter aquaticus TaxID=392597 RepID=A0A5C6TZI0_9BURK|nr:SDR family NAD(P)-dependent oxidoreductase [Piscinibacter aquaticus]